MTFFHFINCVALTYGPLVITYRFSGLMESSSIWSCLRVGVAYVLTQLVKMMLLATFYPQSETDDETLLMDFVKCSVDVIDILGLYLIITKLLGKGDKKILVTAIGWASSEAIATRFLPLWFGARGTEFDWKYIQMSFISNFNLIFIFSVCTFLWLWSRKDTSINVLSLLGVLISIIIYRQILFNNLLILFGSWATLGIHGLAALATGVTAMVLHQ
ncbi:PREDICTED: transmembrane protein 147-like [Amphimedon queenslandica]|uniref:BOS complex subunit TMEM147 n=1 Tax=Amphimedon queenslandica TaxID=400682 RepID=A0A1X7UTY8_AMPQE|nr:PREDICTED: transmembrane protein 147-like [Amphimedon queenslandica]|eukprot:XP_003386780.1 PREDICTED: transmembrane protein 147-like [Amphimedon queenslandica]